MKGLKKLGLGLAVSLIGLGIAVSSPEEVRAEVTLSADEAYDDSLGTNEVKKYNFIMPEDGYIRYEVIPVSLTSIWNDKTNVVTDDEWIKTSYLDSFIKTKGKIYESSRTSYQEGVWRSGRYNFKQGTKISIEVKANPSRWDRGMISFYQILVKVGSEENFEKEENDGRKKATSLIDEGTGNMMNGDIDWWVFKAPKNGTYKISGVVSDLDDEASKVKLENAILNTTSYKEFKRSKQATITAIDGYKNVFKGRLKKGEKVYIQVKGEAYDVFYKLKVSK